MGEKNKIVLKQETIKSIFEKHGEEGLNELISTMSSEILEKVYGFMEDVNDNFLYITFFPTEKTGEFGFSLADIKIQKDTITSLYNIYEKMTVDNILYDYYLNIFKNYIGLYYTKHSDKYNQLEVYFNYNNDSDSYLKIQVKNMKRNDMILSHQHYELTKEEYSLLLEMHGLNSENEIYKILKSEFSKIIEDFKNTPDSTIQITVTHYNNQNSQ